ncbi:hypothetical protein [Desulfogranum japonicum]|uniref:hypothetical protein n=1 Tax=Desulfogranum japonicum TaxID=231447 RepID=UPI00048CD28A|nr:hypothetical protein [Desulfogranum japonicum]
MTNITKSLKTSEFWVVALAAGPYFLQAVLQQLGIDLTPDQVATISNGAKEVADVALQVGDKLDQAQYSGQSVPWLLITALGYAALRTWLKVKGVTLSADQAAQAINAVSGGDVAKE